MLPLPSSPLAPRGRASRATLLAGLVALGAALLPSALEAQGKSGKSKSDKEKDRGAWSRDDDRREVRRDERRRDDVLVASRRDERRDDRRDDRRDWDEGRGRARGPRGKVPRGHLPPAGMCRIWIDGVPPGRQPAPTNCRTAVANRPANARVLWGEGTRRRDRDDGWVITRPERGDDRRRDDRVEAPRDTRRESGKIITLPSGGAVRVP
jgi:hypothetical protein